MSGAKTPLLELVLQGDMDAAGYRILNLDLSFLPSGAPFFDDTALIRGSVDGTKLAHFDLSLIGSAQHRVFQLPNYNGRLATVAGVEDLTNKSINGITFSGTGGFSLTDAIVSLTGGLITNGDLDLGSGHELILDTTADTHLTLPVTGTVAVTSQIPVISDAAYNATTWNGNTDGATKNAIRDKFESLSQDLPPFSDEKTILKNASDETKLLKFDLSALSTATTRTLAVPDKDGTLAMLDDIPDFAGILFDADETDRQFYLAGNVAFFGAFTLAGGFLTRFNVSAATELDLPTEGRLATLDGEETLTSKTIIGGSATLLSELSILPDGLIYPLNIVPGTSGFTSARTLSLNIPNANTAVTLGGNLSTAGALTVAGAYAATLNILGATTLSLPTTGTVCADVVVPGSSGAAGVRGQRAYNSTHLFVCYDTNLWGRIEMETTF